MAVKDSFLSIIPGGYTWISRIRNVRGTLAYCLFEFVPLLLCSYLVNPKLIAQAIVLVLLWLSFYEIGLFYNDARDRARASEEMRSGPDRMSVSTFVVGHCMSIVTWTTMLYKMAVSGSFLLEALMLNVAVLDLLFVHSSDNVRRIPYARIGTFAALAFYKYGVVLMPLLGLKLATVAMAGIFLLYGAARTIVYTIRKYGSLGSTPLSDIQNQIQRTILIFASPVVVLLWWHGGRGAVLLSALWICYAVSLLIIFVGGRVSSPKRDAQHVI